MCITCYVSPAALFYIAGAHKIFVDKVVSLSDIVFRPPLIPTRFGVQDLFLMVIVDLLHVMLYLMDFLENPNMKPGLTKEKC